MKKKRRLLLVLAVFLGLWYWNTFALKVTRAEIADEKIVTPVRIALLSDYHGGSFGPSASGILGRLRQEKPDLVAVVGDMYTYGDEKGRERALSLLTSIAGEFPTYYVNGEHDNSDSFQSELEEAGVCCLPYERREITVGKTKLTLYGITNSYYSPTFDLENAFTLSGNYSILLAHIQNAPAFARFGVNLALCGDTHGGMVRVPFYGAVYYNGGFFPETKGAMVKGSYEVGDTTMFITGGLGNYPIPLRIWNRPEIVILTLHGESP